MKGIEVKVNSQPQKGGEKGSRLSGADSGSQEQPSHGHAHHGVCLKKEKKFVSRGIIIRIVLSQERVDTQVVGETGEKRWLEKATAKARYANERTKADEVG